MRADYSISCDDERYASWSTFAGFMVLVYPVGVPALFAWLLYRIRDVRDDELNPHVLALGFIQEA